MREIAVEGIICVSDEKLLLEFAICRIIYIEREDGAFRYEFRPNYSVMSLVRPPLFQGIPGLNLDLQRKSYIRENQTPVFIAERVPAENREGVYDLIEEVGLDHLNKLEWLMRTDYLYSGDNLYVRRPTSEDAPCTIAVGSLEDIGARSASSLHHLLSLICKGCDVRGNGFSITDENRKPTYSLLKALYKKEKTYLDRKRAEGVKAAQRKKKYRGRQPKKIDSIALEDAVRRFNAGKLTAEQAADGLGVSRATFFRRKKSLENAHVEKQLAEKPQPN